ncbi:globoside alpha-1,3-N-acetylgalactosaminyltransferase 1-like [Platichthys flesus]|uniref:globoside alpha-1,3-N-acetylgalactosaminyltransferase 1-like n=1 Tax=Platichthys flesus TaxID=8260 RepID=UPI002DBA42F2|nr:globoside alpha-1,3-N-acetylgalactosaminyltransferase 1-like [Platichthys flesus]
MNLLKIKTRAVILLCVLLMGLLYSSVRQSGRVIDPFKQNQISPTKRQPPMLPMPGNATSRTDVLTMTSWSVPVVWEGTFNPVLLDSFYQDKSLTIAATVFAQGKYIRFLKRFLETMEQHFFTGFNVHVFVYTDQPNEVPQVKMASGRQLTVKTVPTLNRWQDISASRMFLIQALIDDELLDYADFIFCLDVDSEFHGHWGTESLGDLVGVLHPGYYKAQRSALPYERRPISKAYMAPEEGDFYYCGGAFGGNLQEVQRLSQNCTINFWDDRTKGIEAVWQEESHINRYMWLNKPSKILSPEYLWQDIAARKPEIHIIRFFGVVKNYAEIRPNV